MSMPHVCRCAICHGPVGGIGDASGDAADRELLDRIEDLEGIVARKSALIHRLVEELRKRNEAAKP
jgi:hypothetical protein